MDPTYRHLIMARRKQSSKRGGFIPALLAGLAGANIVAQLGSSLLKRKSGIKRRASPKLIGLSLPQAQKRLLYSKRKSAVYEDPSLPLSQLNKRKAFNKKMRTSTHKRLAAFDRNGAVSRNIIKRHFLRRGKFNRRRGDLDADFLNEFGGDTFNPEPTVGKTARRSLWEGIKSAFGSKVAADIGRKYAKQSEKYIVDKISKLGRDKSHKIASKIIDNKPIPKTYVREIMGTSSFGNKPGPGRYRN